MKVETIKIRKILLTNGKPGLEIEINGKFRGVAPQGTSKSAHEAKSLPVELAMSRFALIKRHLKNQKFADIKEVDETLRLLDKTEDFSFLGANLSLAISYAFLKFFAHSKGVEVYEYVADVFKTKPKIPKPVCNMAGGWHGQTTFQEFLVLPLEQQTLIGSLSEISSFYHKLADRLKQLDEKFNFSRNLESGWVTNLPDEKIIEIMQELLPENMALGLDVAASSFWDASNKVYRYKTVELSKTEQISYLRELAKKFKIHYIEDPFHQDDFISFSLLTKYLSHKLIVGDDLYATNKKRLQYGIDMKATNACIVKPNQIGCVTDTAEFLLLAKKNKMKTVFSHRSVETDDAIIAHLAVGLGSDYVKFGFAGERIVKLNELLRIEEKLS